MNQRYPVRSPRPSGAFVAPKHRIRRWNIVPGDKVRLMVGKRSEKFDGDMWRVYTVAGVELTTNRVYLEGLTNIKTNQVQPVPPQAELDAMTADERQSVLQQRNFTHTRRPVHYSNVQLCVRDAGRDSVFATRVATSAPFYDQRTRRTRWSRFAASLVGGDGPVADPAAAGLPAHPVRGQVRIPWPATEAADTPDPLPVDTAERAAAAQTLNLQEAGRIPVPLIPATLRGPAPGPEDQDWADEYVFAPASRSSPELEAALPLYLQEELSPRFSRAKTTKGWRLRREAEAAARDEHVARAVAEWEAGGRDAGLAELLTLDAVRLEGVSLRPRTRAEIRDAARREFDTQLEHTKKLTRRAAAAGMRFLDGQWVPGAKGAEMQRKRSRKERKLRKIEERLARLTLEDKPNQVIPQAHAN